MRSFKKGASDVKSANPLFTSDALVAMVAGLMSRPQGGLRDNPDSLRPWAARSLSAIGTRFTREGLPIVAALSLADGIRPILWAGALGFLISSLWLLALPETIEG